MKRYIGILSILLILTIGIAYAETNVTVSEDKNKTNGTILYNFITNESNYKEWKMWPGTTAYYPGNPPHGALLTTYVTDETFSAIEARNGELPDESLIVKENYMPNKTLVALTVMYKASGYDPANNDWFWARYAPNGTVLAEGKIKGCIDCHIRPKANFSSQVNDYVFTSNLQKEEKPINTVTTTTVGKIEETVTLPVSTEKSPGFEGIIGFIGLVLIYIFRKK